MNAQTLFGRLALLAPAIGMLVMGILLVLAGSQEMQLDCAQGGQCGWSHGSLGQRSGRVFRVGDIREVRLVTGYGKYGEDSEIMLVHADGTELRFGRTKHADAARLAERARAFFRPGGTPSFTYVARSARWLQLAGFALLGGSVVAGVLGARKRIVARVSRGPAQLTVGEQTARRKRRIKIGLVVGGLVATAATLLAFSMLTTGTLVLDCRTRCRVLGGECTPGQQSELRVEPGEHVVEVWQGAGEALWKPHTVRVEVGETTHFVCQP